MQFYAGDWMSDPKLSMCSAATRGIWMDALCAMHINGRAGELSGTPDQLARVCRCLPAEMPTAIADLKTTGAADVTERNGVVTLICRRMKQESESRKSCSERVKKHRNGSVTPEGAPVKRRCNKDVTLTRALNSESEVRSQNQTVPSINETPHAKNSPALTDAIAAAEKIGCPKSEAERFWNHFESVNWVTRNGQNITNWQTKLASWWSDNDPRNNGNSTRRTAEPKTRDVPGATW